MHRGRFGSGAVDEKRSRGIGTAVQDASRGHEEPARIEEGCALAIFRPAGCRTGRAGSPFHPAMISPVVIRELRAEARHPFTYWLRVLGASAMVLTAVYGFLQSTSPKMAGALLFAR